MPCLALAVEDLELLAVEVQMHSCRSIDLASILVSYLITKKRASKTSQVGTRAARIVRIIRLIRLVRLVKIYKLKQDLDDVKVRDDDFKMDDDEMGEEVPAQNNNVQAAAPEKTGETPNTADQIKEIPNAKEEPQAKNDSSGCEV